jgi:hypothetical protein
MFVALLAQLSVAEAVTGSKDTLAVPVRNDVLDPSAAGNIRTLSRSGTATGVTDGTVCFTFNTGPSNYGHIGVILGSRCDSLDGTGDFPGRGIDRAVYYAPADRFHWENHTGNRLTSAAVRFGVSVTGQPMAPCRVGSQLGTVSAPESQSPQCYIRNTGTTGGRNESTFQVMIRNSDDRA